MMILVLRCLSTTSFATLMTKVILSSHQVLRAILLLKHCDKRDVSMEQLADKYSKEAPKSLT